MRALFAMCLLMVSSCLGHTQTIQRVEITEVGIFTTHDEKTVVAPGTALGTQSRVSHITLAQSTTTIPARLGVEFGFRYRIVGDGKSVAVKITTRVPPPGLRNPNTGNVILTDNRSVPGKSDRCNTRRIASKTIGNSSLEFGS